MLDVLLKMVTHFVTEMLSVSKHWAEAFGALDQNLMLVTPMIATRQIIGCCHPKVFCHQGHMLLQSLCLMVDFGF